jgi:micrococcal nuclease
VVYIVDGGTIDVQIGESRYRVRYIGMDTAERGQPCHDEGKWENGTLTEGQTVCLDKDVSQTDRYGRLLGYVYAGDVMINAELIRRGVASAVTYPPHVRFAEWFVQLEREAREERRGCWADALSYVWLPIVVSTDTNEGRSVWQREVRR